MPNPQYYAPGSSDTDLDVVIIELFPNMTTPKDLSLCEQADPPPQKNVSQCATESSTEKPDQLDSECPSRPLNFARKLVGPSLKIQHLAPKLADPAVDHRRLIGNMRLWPSHENYVHFIELFPNATTPKDRSSWEWADPSPKKKVSQRATEILSEFTAHFHKEKPVKLRFEAPILPLNFARNFAGPSPEILPLVPNLADPAEQCRRLFEKLEIQPSHKGEVGMRPQSIDWCAEGSGRPSIYAWAGDFIAQYGPPKLNSITDPPIKSSPPLVTSPSREKVVATCEESCHEGFVSLADTFNRHLETTMCVNRPDSANGCKLRVLENMEHGGCENLNGGNFEPPMTRPLPHQTSASAIHRVCFKLSSIRRLLPVHLRESLDDSTLIRDLVDCMRQAYDELKFNCRISATPKRPGMKSRHNGIDYKETRTETRMRRRITRARTKGKPRDYARAIARNIFSIKENFHRAILASWRYDSTRDMADYQEMDKRYYLATKIMRRHHLLVAYKLRPSLALLMEETTRQRGSPTALARLTSEIITEINRGLFELRVKCNYTGEWY